MAVDTKMLEQIFQDHLTAAESFMSDAKAAMGSAFSAYGAAITQYVPYEWQIASPPVIGYNPSFDHPQKPGPPGLDAPPALTTFPVITNPVFGAAPVFTGVKPSITYPPVPTGPPSDPTGAAPQIGTPNFPASPSLLPLPAYALPYPFLTIPPAPDIVVPPFNGTPPDPISSISLQEYLDMLSDAYGKYSQDIPQLVLGNWMLWFKSYLGERPLIDKLANAISFYMDHGGAGIPVPIEEAIITRATDRVTAEQRRATLNVYDAAVKRGLLLPSGALLSGLKEARQASAEAVSKVVTDTAIKNLELEHDFMKFMLQLGSELEKWVANFAAETCKYVLEANGQALEVTKFILNGMIEINNTIVKIYIAEWEGYKAAVEVYKAQLQALELMVRLYEAEIKAELAKVEINKAVVETLTAVVQANTAIVNMYKSQIDAESAKVEADRVRVMAYEATVRAYSARVEAWKAQWQGYTARIEGETAKAKVYEAEANAYTAVVNGYKAAVEAYGEILRAQVEQIKAIGTQNEQSLKSWGMVAEQNMKAYTAGIEGYRAEWGAVAEQMKGYAEATKILSDAAFKGYEISMRIDTERAHEHIAEWRSSMESTLKAAEGLMQAANISSSMAASALSGITSFAGNIAAATEGA
jgi:hypothetical protein